MKKSLLVALIALIISGFLIVLGSGDMEIPGGGLPPGGGGGGVDGNGSRGDRGTMKLAPGWPFNFSGVVKEVRPETQQFVLVNGANSPRELNEGSQELITVKPFAYEGQTVTPEIIKSDPSISRGIRPATFGEIQPYQAVSAGGIVKGFAEGKPEWELEAARVHITQQDYLANQEKTYGLGIVTIKSVDADWIALSKGPTLRVMPDAKITTYDRNGRMIPLNGTLTAGMKITINISSRPDRNYEYTNRIFVHN